MGKSVADSVLDAALDAIAAANGAYLCSAQPTTRTEAVSTYALGNVSLSSGDFTKADGSVSGRKVTVAQKTGASITATGTATHLALVSAGALLYVTTVTSQAVTSGNTATFGSWVVEIADPS